MRSQPPRIGITADVARDDQGRPRHQVRSTYVDAVLRAGGVPVILPASGAVREAMLPVLDGVMIIGGDDIDTRPFGVPLHPQAQVMDASRQEAEFALLRALDAQPRVPVLGICLGMQLMGVHRGARLIQHLGDAADLEVIGRSDDGVIEAVRDPSRPFFLGVQWHPERTPDPTMGDGVIRLFVDAARRK